MHYLRQGPELGRGRVGREVTTIDYKHTGGSSGVSGVDKRILLLPTSALHKTLLSNRMLTVLGQYCHTSDFHLRELGRTRRKKPSCSVTAHFLHLCFQSESQCYCTDFGSVLLSCSPKQKQNLLTVCSLPLNNWALSLQTKPGFLYPQLPCGWILGHLKVCSL